MKHSFKQQQSSIGFILLHIGIIKKLLMIDIITLSATAWFLALPVPVHINPIRAGLLFLLVALFLVSLQVQVVNAHIGGIDFYRMLPMRSGEVFTVAHTLAFLPFCLGAALLGGGIHLLGGICPWIDGEGVLFRTALMMSAGCVIKVFVIPTVLLLTKPPVFLALYYLALVPIVFTTLFVDEFVCARLPHRMIWNLGVFLMLCIVFELMIIRKVR